MTDSVPVSAERDALRAVAAAARAQLATLRAGPTEAFETAAAQTLDAVAELDRCQTARLRTSVDAADVRPALRADALDAQQACDDLAFALDHAVALGRDLLGAWQHAASATAHVYDARGHVGPPEPSTRLSQTG